MLKARPRFAAALVAAVALVSLGGRASGDQRAETIYPNGLPTDPSYFPIAVWLQSPQKAPEYRAIGINLFIGLWKGPTEAQLAELARNGMPVIATQNDVALHSANAKMIRGWLQQDEPDNVQPRSLPFAGTCVPAKTVAKVTSKIKLKDPTRPVFLGFGRGVADLGWIGRGPCAGDVAYYSEAAIGADILSFDIYPVASEQYGGQLDYPARGVKRLLAVARDSQRVWTNIETTRIGSRDARVTPAQLRSEALLALIAGANGLIYFAHEFAGGIREDGMFRYPEIVKAVKDTNTLIASLAPVLNSATIGGRVTASSAISSITMLKARDSDLYLFAGSTDSKAGSASFALSGSSNGRAEVIGEDRQVPMVNGVLSDSFGPYEVHIYRITTGGGRP